MIKSNIYEVNHLDAIVMSCYHKVVKTLQDGVIVAGLVSVADLVWLEVRERADIGSLNNRKVSELEVSMDDVDQCTHYFLRRRFAIKPDAQDFHSGVRETSESMIQISRPFLQKDRGKCDKYSQGRRLLPQHSTNVKA